MHLKATGLGAVLLTAWAAPAWGAVHGGVEVVSAYDYPVLGVRVADEAVFQPFLSFDFIGGTEVTAWASSTIEDLDRPFKNAGSELDLTAAKSFGPVTLDAGYFWYPADMGDAYYRASLTLPFDFSMSVQRLAGISNATTFEIASPAYEVGDVVSVQAAILHTETDEDEFEVARGTLAFALTEAVSLKFEAYATNGFEPLPGIEKDEVRGNVRLALTF